MFLVKFLLAIISTCVSKYQGMEMPGVMLRGILEFLLN